MAKQVIFTIEQIEAADANSGGFCIKCGEEVYNVEPDARNYECEGVRRVSSVRSGRNSTHGVNSMNEKCMIEGCTRPMARRGLCLPCYATAKKIVDTNGVTWDRMIELGLCEADKDPFTSAYERATKEE